MQAFKEWLGQLQFGGLFELLLVVLSSLLCITVHETCHGLVAFWLGDDTAKRQGRLSLNPLRHVDPMGLIMMAVARFGWAKPVPINMKRFKNEKLGMALTAIAGPVSNILLLLVAAILRVVCVLLFLETKRVIFDYLIMFFEYTVVLSAGLAVFNLFPIPPLDGSKVLFALLPSRVYEQLMRYERFGMILLIVLLFTDALNAPLMFMRDLLIDFVNEVTIPLAILLQQLI